MADCASCRRQVPELMATPDRLCPDCRAVQGLMTKVAALEAQVRELTDDIAERDRRIAGLGATATALGQGMVEAQRERDEALASVAVLTDALKKTPLDPGCASTESMMRDVEYPCGKCWACQVEALLSDVPEAAKAWLAEREAAIAVCEAQQAVDDEIDRGGHPHRNELALAYRRRAEAMERWRDNCRPD